MYVKDKVNIIEQKDVQPKVSQSEQKIARGGLRWILSKFRIIGKIRDRHIQMLKVKLSTISTTIQGTGWMECDEYLIKIKWKRKRDNENSLADIFFSQIIYFSVCPIFLAVIIALCLFLCHHRDGETPSRLCAEAQRRPSFDRVESAQWPRTRSNACAPAPPALWRPLSCNEDDKWYNKERSKNETKMIF